MLGPTARIQQIRKQTSIRYLVFACIAITIVLAGSVCYLTCEGFFLIKVLAIQAAWLGLAFTWYLITHRRNLLHLLPESSNASIHPLEDYLVARKQAWDSYYPFKILIGCLIAIGFVITLLLNGKENLPQVFAGLFLTFTLAIILKTWLDFNDQILLQDIRHHLKDYSS